MKQYTKKDLDPLTTEAIVVLYALNLAYPKPVSEGDIIKIVDDCKLLSLSRNEIISLLVGN